MEAQGTGRGAAGLPGEGQPAQRAEAECGWAGPPIWGERSSHAASPPRINSTSPVSGKLGDGNRACRTQRPVRSGFPGTFVHRLVGMALRLFRTETFSYFICSLTALSAYM